MHPETQKLAKLIDHAVLHPTHGEMDTLKACEVGKRFGVGAVCVKPCFTATAAGALAGGGVAVCAVTGFPHGNSTTAVKVFETKEAIQNGASEIDVVVNNGWVAEGRWAEVAAEVRAIQQACSEGGAILKVIFEIDFLSSDRIEQLCRICVEAGVAFVKTSTGFGYVKQPNGDFNYKGATAEAVTLMRKHCPAAVRIKAAAGIRTLADLIRFRDLGCERIGTSATEAILAEAEALFSGGEQPAPFPGAAGGY